MNLSQSALALRALAALDLTSLGDDDDLAHIDSLCASVATPFGTPAAVCVYPEWVATCRARLADAGLPVRVATVVNFPDGSTDAARVHRETRRAIGAGAHEIDVVMPYRALCAGDVAAVEAVLRACRDACADRAKMKVILETGELRTAALIGQAAQLALAAGADFLKTSTGKVAINATPGAARILLEAIRASGVRCGFKAAGGIRTLDDAAIYFALAEDILGPGWATPDHFRFGASALLGEILRKLGSGQRSVAEAY